MKTPASISLICLTLLALAGCMGSNSKQAMENEEEVVEKGKQVATVGGGCFWCTEAVFELVEGVVDVVSGYAGGTTLNPTYDDICTGNTGHAEVIKITYDPAKVSYDKLLKTFGVCHDPTTLNQQGFDTGTQYRSVIMYHDDEQKASAEKWKIEIGKEFIDPIVTEIVEAPVFYLAEEDHQDFFRRYPNAGYCAFVIRPKLEKVKAAQEQEK
ncbi:MAG: peptide-methionine (S)-S-oxide reductase MsrA [Opitutales bacterium]